MVLLHKLFHQIKAKKNTILRTFFFASTFIAYAQSPLEEQYFMEVLRQTNNFNEIVDTVEKHYENRDKGQGSGYKQWKRWEYFYSTRLMPDGTVPNLGAVEWDAFNKSSLLSQKNTKSAAQKSEIAGNWISMGPDDHIRYGQGYNGGIGRINCIAVDPSDPNIIYAGTPAGGLWKSTTGGNSWIPLTDNLPSLGISGIAIDYQSSSTNRTIYILTGDGDGGHTQSIGVLKSTDNGATWLSTGLFWEVNQSNSGNVGYKLIMHPTNNQEMLVATSSGIYKTEDGANSWEQVTEYQRIYDIEYKPGNPDYMYAAGAGFVMRSKNGGDSWEELSSDVLPIWGARTAIAVTPDEPDYLYALYSGTTGAGTMRGVFRSTDSGDTFSLRSDTPNILGYDRYGEDNKSQSYYDLAIAVSPEDADEVHVGGINCWKSENGGTSWTNTSYWIEYSADEGGYTHADIHALEFYNGTLYSGSDGGIYKTDNSTNGWENISSGLVISQMYRIGLDPTNPNRFLHGSQDNGSNKIENGSFYHWYGADGFECIVDPSYPERIYGSYQYGGIFRSEDSGLSITNIQPDDAGSGNWDTPYTLDPENSDIIYAGYIDLWKSEDRGDSWTNISNGDLGFSTSRQVVVAPSDSDYIYILKSNRLYYSQNGGSSWTENSDLGSSTKTYLTVHPSDPEIIWYTVGGFEEGEKVFKSTDGGETFTNVSGSLPNIPVNCIVYENGSNNGIYIGTDLGVFYINDDLSDWILFSNNLPTTIVKELEIQYTSGKLYAGTFGRGMWTSDLYQPAYKDAETVAETSPGLSYSYYEGEWRLLPDFSTLSANEERNIANINLSPKKRDTNFALDFNGYINIPQDGIYVFYLNSDDGSKLYIGDTEVIDNDRTHTATEKLGGIGLRKGYHSIRVSYFQSTDDSELSLSYSGPGISKQEVPSSILFSSGGSSLPENCTASNNINWTSQSISEKNSNFSVEFNITPNMSNMDGVFGFSDTAATTYSQLGMIIRFNTSGNIDVRNGPSYASTTVVPYSPNTTYNFRMTVDFNTKKYNVYVSQGTQQEILLADNFDFRSEKSSLYRINSWSTFSNFGAITICDIQDSADTTPNKLPEISVISPTNGIVYTSGDSIELSAKATDTDGNITEVTWYSGNQLIFKDYNAPYEYTWNNISTGTYIINATATDNDGGVTWSYPIAVVVNEARVICETSSINWSGISMGSTETGTFEALFEVTPNMNNMDGVIGLSNSEAIAYSDLAVMIRLNQNGVFDVRNGSSYMYSTAVNYTAGTTYTVRFDVDINSKKYDVYVSAPDVSETQIASDFDFRTDQLNVSNLQYWSWISGIGTYNVCNPQVSNTGSFAVNNRSSEMGSIQEDQIKAIPNPASDSVMFFLGTVKGMTKIHLIDISGLVIQSETKEGVYDTMEMDVSRLENGVYIAQLYINGKTMIKKVVIQH